jgi:hypothetical protein
MDKLRRTEQWRGVKAGMFQDILIWRTGYNDYTNQWRLMPPGGHNDLLARPRYFFKKICSLGPIVLPALSSTSKYEKGSAEHFF